ncbi:sulfotransferase [Streptomyces sp. NPDC002550]
MSDINAGTWAATSSSRAAAAWAVTARLAPPSGTRAVQRLVHHTPYPQAPGLLARRVSADPRGLRVRYLFDTRAAACAFSADEDAALRPLGRPVTGPVRAVPAAPLTAPVIIVSAPRSGSTALFTALARNPALWTVGGESEGVIEGVPELHPAARGYASHGLGARDADRAGPAVRAGFLADLRDARGRRLLDWRGSADPPPRLLEKTPENALRMPFLLRLFPDATVIHLRREPRDTVASMVRAWCDPGFVNIPDLPGWWRHAWHLLLPDGWHRWAGDDLSRVAARQWAGAIDGILDARDHMTSSRWLDVEYAELTAAPARTVRRLETALGLPASPLCPDVGLSPTTVTPPRPGKWRVTPGYDPASLDEVAATICRFGSSGDPVQRGAGTRRRPPLFACWLQEAGTGTDRAPTRPLVVDPTFRLQEGLSIPLDLVRRARFRERFLPNHPILWVEHPGTGALAPYWVRGADHWALRHLTPGEPPPGHLPERLRTALVAAGVLAETEERRQRAARYDALVTDQAQAFAATDLCRIDGMLPSAHRRALLDYYDRLIATGSWPLGDHQVAGRYGWHNESLSRFFHHQFTTLISRLAGQAVRPSYAYVSAYRGGAVLDRHVDRAACEVTVSLVLGQTGQAVQAGWPLHLEARGGTVSLTPRPGDAVVFRGTRVPHHRPPLPDESTYTSLLFHYVPACSRRT